MEREPITRAHLEAEQRADAFDNPETEFGRRFPDLSWKLHVDVENMRAFIIGRWTRAGIACGFAGEVPLGSRHGDLAVLERRKMIARYALFLDEFRTGGR